MKKIELLYFTVAKNCVSTARHCRAVALFSINCSKLTRGTRMAYFFLSSRWRFSVEQMTFSKKVSSSQDSSRCISSSWPWLVRLFHKFSLTFFSNLRNGSLHCQSKCFERKKKRKKKLMKILHRWSALSVFFSSLKHKEKLVLISPGIQMAKRNFVLFNLVCTLQVSMAEDKIGPL